jgi:hypothetical protein
MSETRSELQDPVMAEVRQNRHALSQRFGGDLRKLAEYLNAQAQEGGRKIVTFPTRRPSAVPPAA